jgi:hypothetical protein
MSDFGECLYRKDLQALYAMLHCVHQLHEALADDTTALAEHLEEQKALVTRQCDLCGENLTRRGVYEMLTVLKSTIARREAEMEQIGRGGNE